MSTYELVSLLINIVSATVAGFAAFWLGRSINDGARKAPSIFRLVPSVQNILPARSS
jgi:hypothetical protein